MTTGSESSEDYLKNVWENDPFLTSTPERTAKVKASMMEHMRRMKIPPSMIKDNEVREAYWAWLKEHPEPNL